MLTTQLFIVPFFVVGRRMTLTIEIRGRSSSDLPLNGDRLVFDYDGGDRLVFDFDSGRDEDTYEGLPRLCLDATVKLRESLQEMESLGWPLSLRQKKFVAQKAPSIEWLYDAGPGERASVPELFLECLLELGD